MKSQVVVSVDVPEGVSVSLEDGVLRVTGPNGELARTFDYPGVSISVDSEKIILSCEKATRREKNIIYTFVAHIKNMLRGAQEDFVYKLKICSGHFPMNVSVSGDTLIIKNFLGEAVPRVLKLKQGCKVKLDGDIIEVRSNNKELAGAQASDLEQLTRITNRDRRIFQDGLYIIEKGGGSIK